jgi:putative addiction module component (TIGR02574 family)
MSHALRAPPVGFDDLPVEDQIDYVQALWDRIAAREEQVPVPGWHRALLDERLAECDQRRDPSTWRRRAQDEEETG